MSDLNIVPEVPQDTQAQSTQSVPTSAPLLDTLPATAQIAAEETPTTPNDTAPDPTTAGLATPATSVPDAIPATPQIAAPAAIPAAPQTPDVETPTTDAAPATPAPAPKTRIFKIGATRIVADANTAHLSQEEVRAFLKPTYPEVANAAIHETNLDENTIILNFLAQPGRKG